MAVNFSKKVTIICLLIFSVLRGYPQEKYHKSDHVSIRTDVSEGFYRIKYSFKDQFEIQRTFLIDYSKHYADKMIEKFGVPKSYFEPYLVTPRQKQIRNQRIKYGLFRQRGQMLEIDKSAIVRHYSEDFCKPIANRIIETLKEENRDTRNNRIEFAMKFAQDIPYGVPEPEDSTDYNGGILVPPEVLIKGYGDCDSKSLLFASILIYLINPDDIVFLGQQGHVLTAIKMDQVGPGMHYYELEDGNYAIAETAGPARKKLGYKGSNTQNSSIIEPLNLNEETETPALNEYDLSHSANDDFNSFETIKYSDHSPEVADNNCFRIIAQNNTLETVYIILKYKNLNDHWNTKGWYRIPPGGEKLIGKTQNKYIYFYAVSDEGEWRGDHLSSFKGEDYMFNEMFVNSDHYGTFTVMISK